MLTTRAHLGMVERVPGLPDEAGRVGIGEVP
jgi:hypothetical protein